MKTVLLQLMSITGREARSSYFFLPPVPVASASTLLPQTSLYYTTLTGKYQLRFASNSLTESPQEPSGGPSSHGSCTSHWSDKTSVRVPIHHGGECRRTDAGARCAEAATGSASHSTRSTTITKRYACSHAANHYLLTCRGCKAANKEELLEMITHGAEKIVNSTDAYVFPYPLAI